MARPPSQIPDDWCTGCTTQDRPELNPLTVFADLKLTMEDGMWGRGGGDVCCGQPCWHLLLPCSVMPQFYGPAPQRAPQEHGMCLSGGEPHLPKGEAWDLSITARCCLGCSCDDRNWCCVRASDWGRDDWNCCCDCASDCGCDDEGAASNAGYSFCIVVFPAICPNGAKMAVGWPTGGN